MTEEAIKEIANQLGVAVTEVVPKYAEANVAGYSCGIIITLIIALICYILLRKVNNHCKKQGFLSIWDAEIEYWFAEIFLIIMFIICFIFVMIHIYEVFMWSSYPDMMFFNKIINMI